MFCHECGHGVHEGAKFCPECGTRLGGGRPAVEQLPVETRRNVTVLFIDITGSTPLGERLDPEAMRRILSRYFGEVATIVARHGGTLESSRGDALVAVFGLPVLHEDDALRAVRAAVEARSALAVVNDELIRDYELGLDTRTGVNTGEVVGGDSPTGSTLATGDMVERGRPARATRAAGEIVIGEATYRLVRDAITVEELEPLRAERRSPSGCPRTASSTSRRMPGARASARVTDRRPLVRAGRAARGVRRGAGVADEQGRNRPR